MVEAENKQAVAAVIERFRALVPVDNPSGQESAIREVICNQLGHYPGLRFNIDEEGNLLVQVPGKADAHPILLSAHMDSVPPCQGIESVLDQDSNGRTILRSAGKTILGADDKSGIAVILDVVDRLAAEGFSSNHPLELFFTVKEEVGLLGAKAFDYQTVSAPYGYVLDGEGTIGTIFTIGPTQVHFNVAVQGKPSHAGMAPEKGVSAIAVVGKILARLPLARISESTTLNVGLVQGGVANNVVPAKASFKGEARSRNADELEQLLLQIRSCCETVQQECPEAKIELEIIPRYALFNVPADHLVVNRASSCMESMGIIPQVAPMCIGSDAHILNQNNLPTVVLGMGFHRSHSLGEFLFVDELAQMSELTWRLVQYQG